MPRYYIDVELTVVHRAEFVAQTPEAAQATADLVQTQLREWSLGKLDAALLPIVTPSFKWKSTNPKRLVLRSAEGSTGG